MGIIAQRRQRTLEWLIAADNLLQRVGQRRHGLIVTDVEVIHSGTPGGGIVTDVLFGDMALDLFTVGLAVGDALRQVQYPRIQRGQLNEALPLFDKIALQSIAGEELRDHQFFIITGDEHVVEGGTNLVAQIQIGGQHA